jgi:hypothetical protein
MSPTEIPVHRWTHRCIDDSISGTIAARMVWLRVGSMPMKKEMTMSKHRPSPNDQRSDALNPNNRSHKASQDNRSRQLDRKDNATPPAAPPTNHAPASGSDKRR